MTVNHQAPTANPEGADDLAALLACVAAGDIPDDAVTGIPVTAFEFKVDGELFTEWAYVGLAGDGEPGIQVSIPPSARDGEVRLTAAEALRLAGALVGAAWRTTGGLVFSPG